MRRTHLLTHRRLNLSRGLDLLGTRMAVSWFAEAMALCILARSVMVALEMASLAPTSLLGHHLVLPLTGRVCLLWRAPIPRRSPHLFLSTEMCLSLRGHRGSKLRHTSNCGT